MSSSRKKSNGFLSPAKDYSINESTNNEFILTVKHDTEMYNEFKEFAEKNSSGFTFSVIDHNTVKLHVKAIDSAEFCSANHHFHVILRFLNSPKLSQLSTRDYDEIYHRYEAFLKKNNLHEYTSKRLSKSASLDYHAFGGNMSF